jgi:hypothetical protein
MRGSLAMAALLATRPNPIGSTGLATGEGVERLDRHECSGDVWQSSPKWNVLCVETHTIDTGEFSRLFRFSLTTPEIDAEGRLNYINSS